MTDYNPNSPAVQRIFKELRELKKGKSAMFVADPLENNIFEWHFTMRGPRNTEFEGGVYHGKILLPSEYPLKPPDIIFLTPNGRFEVGKKICLTISSHHAETWSASWSVRTVILAIIGFFPTLGDGAIASLDWSKPERQKLAKASLGWKCDKCGSYNLTALPQEEALKEDEEENNIHPIRLKNKEEQEKDEAEKKRQEELKKLEEQGCSSQLQTTPLPCSSQIQTTPLIDPPIPIPQTLENQSIQPDNLLTTEKQDSTTSSHQILRQRENNHNREKILKETESPQQQQQQQQQLHQQQQ